MVREGMHKDKKIYYCEECGFGYLEKRYAVMCEEYCRKMGACSMEITKFAVSKPLV